MSNAPSSHLPTDTTRLVRKGLAARKRRQQRQKWSGLGAIGIGLSFLAILFASMIGNGYTAFQQTYIQIELLLDEQMIDPQGTRQLDTLSRADYLGMVKKTLRERFPEVTSRRDKKRLYSIISSGAAYQLRNLVMNQQELIGTRQSLWVPADDDIDMLIKGHIDRNLPESSRRVSDQKIAWVDELVQSGQLRKQFNVTFFTAGDSREPELAGIWGAALGSFYALLVTLVLAFPIGVASAIYLEEFAPKNRWTDLIEVNINNLAAVPSIVFGLLGLAVFINFMGLPRSVPLVGGLVLSLMTLPTIIIAGRAALQSVPPSIREAALGLGASRMQAVLHHLLPLALPGMLTGAIIGMARALGESAPLLMIGMVAFVVDIPGGFTDPSTALPVQIYLWADSPERAFLERTSAATLVLLAFLLGMNAIAIYLRKRFERKW